MQYVLMGNPRCEPPLLKLRHDFREVKTFCAKRSAGFRAIAVALSRRNAEICERPRARVITRGASSCVFFPRFPLPPPRLHSRHHRVTVFLLQQHHSSRSNSTGKQQQQQATPVARSPGNRYMYRGAGYQELIEIPEPTDSRKFPRLSVCCKHQRTTYLNLDFS